MASITPTSHLQRLIALDSRIEYLRFEEEMPTTAIAAKVLGVAEEQIIKTCLIKGKKTGSFVAVILLGVDRIDPKKFAAIFEKYSFVSGEEAFSLTGYPAGGIPPIGLGERITVVYVDRKVLSHGEVYGGGGEKVSLIRIPSELLVSLNAGQVVDIAEERTESEVVR